MIHPVEEHNNNKYHNSVNKGQVHSGGKKSFATIMPLSQQYIVWVDVKIPRVDAFLCMCKTKTLCNNNCSFFNFLLQKKA